MERFDAHSYLLQFLGNKQAPIEEEDVIEEHEQGFEMTITVGDPEKSGACVCVCVCMCVRTLQNESAFCSVAKIGQYMFVNATDSCKKKVPSLYCSFACGRE